VLLLTIFAVLALLLAALGVYGVISYSVSRQVREIGIRMALGAQRHDILKLVVAQGLVLALIGVTCGLMAAFGLTRFLSGVLYGLTPTDPATFVILSLFLLGVAILATYIPAWRAARVDPMAALRYE
jgi:ABC-type antimicrobial peptide transport system permease subunit